MIRLPFVVEPRRQPILEAIGSDESGKIEIERRGYLSTGEKSFVQQVQQFDNGTSEIITVSRRVARKYALGMDKAYNMVLTIISGTKANSDEADLISEVESEFAEDLTDVVKSLAAGQAREDLVYAACLIKYRIDPNFEISEISSIHPDIIEGLAKLYRDEETRSIEAWKAESISPEEGEEATGTGLSVEEAEKKSTKTRESRSRTTTGG